jgi:hypothetical protein
MKNGIVMKTTEKYAIVCSDETFIRIKIKNGLRQGQHIFLTDEDLYLKTIERRTIMNGYMKFVAIAASLLIIITAGVFLGNDPYASIVVVDINPSVQLMLNSNDIVIDAKALNADAESLDLSGIKGMQVADAVEYVTELAVKGDFLDLEDLKDDYILVTVISDSNKEAVEKLIAMKISKSELLQSVNVVSNEDNEETLKSAKQNGKALGLMALREKYGLAENENLGDFFSDPERRVAFENNGKIFDENPSNIVRRIDENLDKTDLNDEEKAAIKSDFLTAKANFMETIKSMQVAAKALQAARESGDQEAIEKAIAEFEKAKSQKDAFEQIKDEVEKTKDVLMDEVEKIKENPGKPENVGKPKGVGKPKNPGKSN